MKVTVLSVLKSEGVSKKTGNPFVMHQVTYLTPFNPYSNKPSDYTKEDEKNGKAWYAVSGYGVNTAQANVDPDAFQSFSRLTFPVTLNLTTETDIRNGRPEVIVTGFVAAEVAKAA